MNTALSLLLTGILLSLPVGAQTIPGPPPAGITGSTYVGAFDAEVTFGPPSGPTMKIKWIVANWATGTGTEYSMDVATIELSGETSIADTMTSTAIFDRIGRESVVQGAANGYGECPVSSEWTGLTLASCVERTLGGFLACGSSVARHAYKYSCDDLASSITGEDIPGGSCNDGCESTGSGSTLE